MSEHEYNIPMKDINAPKGSEAGCSEISLSGSIEYNDPRREIPEETPVGADDNLSNCTVTCEADWNPTPMGNEPSSTSSSNSHISISTYEKTLKEWREKATKTAFIYDFILDKYRKRVDLFTLLAFLLTSMTSLLALGNFGLSEIEYPTLALGLKTLNVFLTTFAAICSGIIQMRGWSTFVNNCQKYLDSVEHFIASIISEQSLPIRFRTDPEQFILQQKDKFLAILNSAPDISHSDYLHALENFKRSKTRFRHDLIK